ncbi:hypothetical protein HMN09_00661700 [Mycena chlorophos]|uniref:Acyl-CoA oxidase C-alpha1 domain-containing protein n=1 Tax=Mycena chlorophos TaxID=658473 RepID=A0A8H6T0Q8_MYCCL|nr:hypothetical protein HMN09_00661700 [Mycena chlorophos]
MQMRPPTAELAQTPLFQLNTDALPHEERISLGYTRARLVAQAYSAYFTTEDIRTLSPKFWAMHTDPIWAIDGSAAVLCTLQLNLVAGTLAMFSRKRPDVQAVLDRMLTFEIAGQFCVTELSHGLDAFHMETTATLLESGEWEIHTPNPGAAKYMPPTAPGGSPPAWGVVFARAMVSGEDHGVKPFLFQFHDGKEMLPGIVARLLPPRGGSHPLKHCLTSFEHLRVPASALLGPVDKPADPRIAFFLNIQRVAIGTLAIGSLGYPSLQIAATIAALYSRRRTVLDTFTQQPKTIFEFQTQKIPICTATAQAFVMEAFQDRCVKIFCDVDVDWRVRHAIAAIGKVVMLDHAQEANLTLGERCGAQGLYTVNQLTAMHADLRGTAIAEGDMLAISIRFGTELLLDRYAVPPTADPSSLLARHEAGTMEELRARIREFGHHRTESYNALILPELMPLIKAIGHRLAYDAAVACGVDRSLVDLYVVSCVELDLGWYIERGLLTKRTYREMQAKAVEAVYQQIDALVEKMDVGAYIKAPIVSEERWDAYLQTLPVYRAKSNSSRTVKRAVDYEFVSSRL